jgi:uncharacterized protein (TIGR00725 family)
MPRRLVVGVIGPGEGATPLEVADAHRIGTLLAGRGWVVLTGGRDAGVMEAASRGAREAGGLTLGLLPGSTPAEAAAAVELAIPTGLGEARDNLVVLASDALVCCGMSAGTAAEVALALQAGRPLVLVRPSTETVEFLRRLTRAEPSAAPDPDAAVELVASALARR